VYKENRIYIEKTKTYQTETETFVREAYLFPDELSVVANVQSKEEPLKRSIYESVVYTADMKVNGTFPAIDLSDKDVEPKDILWDKISAVVKTSNLKGIRNTLEIQLGDQALSMTPKYSREYMNIVESSVAKDISAENNAALPFSLQMKVNGSESLQFIPIGKETTVQMTSNWDSPSHMGEYLPEDGSRVVDSTGFKASWKVLQINREFEQRFYNELPDLQEFAFGTKLIIPVDEYQKSERTAKYGFLVIGLTLLVFLLIQIASKIYIHPFQYVMIGLALMMFYTLLISISEHSTFLKAYAIAAGSVLGLILLYSKVILKGWKFPLLVGVSLASLYGFIYVIIQLENYALLVGSIGLFAILAIVMFASRKIDWGND
jgi:inner membrane protein